MLKIFIRKCRSARFYFDQHLERLGESKAAKAREGHFKQWLKSLNSKPPEVLIGSNFVEFGGCRHHMHALNRFSSLTTQLAPSETVYKEVGAHHLGETFRESFLQFRPHRIKVGHSHVFPWFVDWCHRHQQNGLRWIHTHHNWYYPEFGKAGLEEWQEKLNETFIFALKNANVSLCVSKWQQAYLRSAHGLDSHYLPNGVDVGLCDAARAARFRSTHGPNDFILYLGRNDPVKNPAEFAKLAWHLPHQNFLMIGQGLSADVLSKEWMVVLPPNLLIKDAATHVESLDAIAACSALVVTSKREGLPTLVLEAMALGKPIVVPNEEGCMEAIQSGECGFIYELGNIDDLARKTELALVDKIKCSRSRARILQEYDWNAVIPKLDAIYRGENPF